MSILNSIESVTLSSLGRLPLKDTGSSFNPGGVTRHFVPGQSVFDGGFTESRSPSHLSVALNTIKGLDWDQINAISSDNITICLSDGSVYMMPDAWCEGQVQLSDSNLSVTFAALNSEKIT